MVLFVNTMPQLINDSLTLRELGKIKRSLLTLFERGWYEDFVFR